MAYQATVIPVMIASPGDVHVERGIARDEIHQWNYVHSSIAQTVLMPVAWETHSSPELSGRPQELINRRILVQCDLLVGIFWTRIGSATGRAVSGTVEEIQEHMTAGKPAMVYFSTAPAEIGPLALDQWDKLQEFKAWCRGKGLVWEFDDPDDFRLKFSRQLQIALRDNEHLKSLLLKSAGRDTAGIPIPVSPPLLPSSSSLSAEARTILLEATLDKKGQIIHFVSLGGETIQANRRKFGEGERGRELARWKGAMEELERERLIQTLGPKREVFEVTHKGWELADRMRLAG